MAETLIPLEEREEERRPSRVEPPRRSGSWVGKLLEFFSTHSKVVVPETFLLYKKLLRFVPVSLWLPYKIFIIKQPVWSLLKIIQVIGSQTGLINKENKHESK